MWSLYRCPHCQGISTGKQWKEAQVKKSERQEPELICPVCGKTIPPEKRITLWECWHSAS